MRLALLTSVAASLLLGVFSASCGGTGEPSCCPDNFCSDVDADCVDGACVVAVPGQGACKGMGTKRGEPCCNLKCDGAELFCSAGTCVDEDIVLDQSGLQGGQEGGECIGEDQLCDETEDFALECVDGVCVAPAVVQDSSVRPSFDILCSFRVHVLTLVATLW